MYKRVLLKISGEALSSSERPLDFDKIEKTAEDIKALHDSGMQIGIVTGGGNIMRGRDSKDQDRTRMDNMGMLATAINALALQDCLLRLGVPAVVMSAVAMNRFCDEFSARHAVEAIETGKVVLFAAGSGSPYFSTDTASALRALEIKADALLLAKNIDAVYSADPKKNPDAVKYDHISYNSVLKNNLQATDLTAITLCREQNLPILVFALKEIRSIAQGNVIGTRIDADED
jgi:uridylate kinase